MIESREGNYLENQIEFWGMKHFKRLRTSSGNGLWIALMMSGFRTAPKSLSTVDGQGLRLVTSGRITQWEQPTHVRSKDARRKATISTSKPFSSIWSTSMGDLQVTSMLKQSGAGQNGAIVNAKALHQSKGFG